MRTKLPWHLAAVLCSIARQHAAQHVTVAGPGIEMVEVPTVKSEHGSLDTSLQLGPVHIGGVEVSFESRALNGSIPGPTIVVQPGDVLRVLFQNKLQAPDGSLQENTYAAPNRTNLHVHGLHVSPLAPGDDVLGIAIDPGQEYPYEHQLLHDHSPGTYWYHPHYHGSTLIQSGAGAAGALVVADPPGYLSSQLKEMPDRVVVLQEFPRTLLGSVAAKSDDQLFRIQHWGAGQDLWLANGALCPALTLQSGVWQRLRLVAAGVSNWLSLDFGECTVALLAKDGIYIDDFPRYVKNIQLPQGGRADVVVHCPGQTERDVDHEVVSLGQPAKFAGLRAKSFNGTVFMLRVPATHGEVQPEPLKAWTPPSRPRYLEDLRLSNSSICTCSTSLGIGGNTRWIEGHLWEGKTHYMHSSPRNAVAERRLSGIQLHPYHQHTFPFQLLRTPGGDDPFFRSGDWHDTYLNVQDSRAVVRYHTVDYVGPQVVHCHNPAHSDTGMIAVEMVSTSSDLSACGCDLLDDSHHLSAQPTEDPLLTVAVVAFAAMLGVSCATAGVLLRDWKRASQLDSYHQMREQPVRMV